MQYNVFYLVAGENLNNKPKTEELYHHRHHTGTHKRKCHVYHECKWQKTVKERNEKLLTKL